MKLQIKIDGKTYQAEVEILEEEEESQTAFVPYTSAPLPVQTPVPRSTHQPVAAGAGAANQKQYVSPVNGLVVRVNVAPGQQIQPNDVLMVLEAMKMENNVVAHSPGTVKSVNVTLGNSVKLHQVLMELE